MSDESMQFLLRLARNAIVSFPDKPEIRHLTDEMKAKNGVFVTVYVRGKLRGCIGCLAAVKPVYQAIIENAISAAYSDKRFLPVRPQEFTDMQIEISLLTEPAKLHYKDAADLLQKLKTGDGIIISRKTHFATFLPKVWEELPKPEDFLSHLCLKAGLLSGAWRNGDLEVFVYHAETLRG